MVLSFSKITPPQETERFNSKSKWFLSWLSVKALLFLFLTTFPLATAYAAPVQLAGRNPEFITPVELRGRVDFWKDVFSKYERNQIVIHHREWPQVRFGVLDLRAEAQAMDPVSFERFRKRAVDRRIDEVKASLLWLAQGNEPRDDFERSIVLQMSFIDGGPAKYSRAVKEDLVRSQSGIREKWVAAIERSGRYLPLMEKIFVQDFGLPREVTRLPFVESSFDYSANSSVGAAGIWQFMPRTARQFMTVNKIVDERRDPITATEAAAQYLRSAYQRLGSWPLAITAYNHGAGGVAQKVQRMGTSNISALIEHPTERVFGFASNNFFPSFLAAVECYDERQTLFPDARPEPVLQLSSTNISRPMSVDQIVRAFGTDTETIRKANYALTEQVWQGRAKIPAGYLLRFPQEYRESLGRLNAPDTGVIQVAPPASSVYGGVFYKVRSGDTILSIAKRHGITVAQLTKENNIKGKTIKVGQILKLKGQDTREEKREAQLEEETTQPASQVTATRLIYQVKPGDTLVGLARRFDTTTEIIQADSNLSAPRIHVGQTLIIRQEPIQVAAPVKATKQVAKPKKVQRSYKVRSGDSLASIAKRYNVSVANLKKANRLKSDHLSVGKQLAIP